MTTRYVIFKRTGSIVSEEVAAAIDEMELEMRRMRELLDLVVEARGPNELEHAQDMIRATLERKKASNGHI